MTLSLSVASLAAQAWTRPGHMLTAAIAFDDLSTRKPQLIERVAATMAQHPDRSAFEVAMGDANGQERTRRLFMEMARWPDDVRSTAYDHPTWHYAGRSVVDKKKPPPKLPPARISGAAFEAFALNAAIVADQRAPQSERAIALCWLFHLVGDIHQPLHAADEFSASYPEGDRGGGRQFVVVHGHSETLHNFWDEAVQRSSNPASVQARARDLMKQHARPEFSELARDPQGVRNFSANFLVWADESLALARTQAYREDLLSSPVENQSPTLSRKYIEDSTAVAERRATLASYRLADLLIALLEQQR
jgi:hypothetical protein